MACKAVLNAITSLEYTNDIEYNPLTAAQRDPIAVLRQAIRAVCHSLTIYCNPNHLYSLVWLQIRASPLRRQTFDAAVKLLKMVEHQLLRDVDTRWSSTLLMIDRGLEMRPVSHQIIVHCKDVT